MNPIRNPQSAIRNRQVPGWSADAIWYQVFVSRFCNGDPANDPPGTLGWTDDWSSLEAGERPPLRQRLFGRRYGGDLQGLRSKLPYLRELGVNTLYLNPVFQAPSQHKYDTTDHRHVDDTYGVPLERVSLQRTGETQDPATWRWTASDRMFLDFLAAAHRQGFRVVLDGVFNHVGPKFWAWRDVKRNGRASRYAGWFDVTEWAPDGTGVKSWHAWDGPNGRLVNFRQTSDGLHRAVEAYLFAVVRRWMDPDGDGDPRDGIDGWRLDAAEKVPHGFWRRFRRVVRSMNPEAIIIGEIWTDASDWLGGDQFDVVTNYRFSGPVTRFFGQGDDRYSTSAFVEELAAVRRDHPPDVTLGMLNLLGSHDTARAVTMLADPTRHAAASGEIPKRDLLRPDEASYRRLKLAAFFQFTYSGAPMIYYGDEVGMYGGDDPFCRAPMWWPRDDEAGDTGKRQRPSASADGTAVGMSHPLDAERVELARAGSTPPPTDEARPDVLAFYKELARLRRDRVELRRGRFRLILADDARRLFAFSRRYGRHEAIMVVNGDTADHRVTLNIGQSGQAVEVRTVSTEHPGRAAEGVRRRRIGPEGRLEVVCPALSGRLILLILTNG